MNEISWENEIIKDLILWDNYADFEYKHTGSIVLLLEYSNFRTCLSFWLGEKYDEFKKRAPEINEKNYIKIWFRLGRVINKQSLKRINNDYNYEFKKRFHGITAVKNEKLLKNENNEKI